MSPVVELLIAIALPTAAGYAIIWAIRGSTWWAERRRASRYQQAVPAEPADRLGASLRRLRAELETTETRTGLTAKHLKVTALRQAYVDALSTACAQLDVTPPSGAGRALQAEIYRVEAELRQCGLDVREAALH